MIIAGSYDLLLVALSILIATVASYTALDLAGRIATTKRWASHAWLITAAFAMGGGIWAMHFVAMLAFSMPDMPVNYDIGLTVISFILPIIVTGVGFYAVNRPAVGFGALALSGVFMGLGIAGMHYTGMAAMRMAPVLSYDRLWVAASVLIAIGASTVALWLAFRNTGQLQKLIAAVAMGFAISGMHYAAMQGAIFSAPSMADETHGHSSLGQTTLAIAVAATTILIMSLALVAAMIDRRFDELAQQDAAVLRQSEERFRLLVQSVSDYAIYMLDPSGRVTNWNVGAERIKGYSADEIMGEHFSRFYTEEDKQRELPRHALTTATRDGKFENEGWRVRKDGSRFWASVVVDPIRDEGGDLIGFAKITRDITERKRAQEALEEAREALFQAQKLESIGALTGGVAHDFNNLLAVMLGNLELLRKRVADDPKAAHLVETALQAAQRGATLTQRMLAFARRQELSPESVDVLNLVHGMSDLLQRSIGPMARVETRFPMDLPRAHVDSHQLELALLNLVVNARDAMPEGGTITIGARKERVGADRIGGLTPGDYVCLSVADTGEGMDETILARAMEPFFTTKGIGKGTGLGLSMVHGLAEQSGGRLLLKSRRGEGTTAEIWLPISTAPVQPQTSGKAEHEVAPVIAASSRSLTVLAVDDDALVLMNTAAMLEDLGHQVVEACSAPEALEILRSGKHVDLVVTDQAMPGMTGIQLASAIRSDWPHLPIILATGYADLPTDTHLVVRKLNKPFQQDALARVVENCMAEVEPST